MSNQSRWQSEKTAAWLSEAVAAAEPDAVKAKLFRQMARAAEEQASILAANLEEGPCSYRSARSSREKMIEGSGAASRRLGA